jgi:hypothetical protein
VPNFFVSARHRERKKKVPFYLPHMEYEGSIGFVSRKIKKIIADFHVLGLFMAKKHDLSEKKFSVLATSERFFEVMLFRP